MDYYVNADYPTQTTTVHEGYCPHCNQGQGQKMLGRVYKTSEWLGPFATRGEAFERARRTGLTTVRGCGHWRP